MASPYGTAYNPDGSIYTTQPVGPQQTETNPTPPATATPAPQGNIPPPGVFYNPNTGKYQNQAGQVWQPTPLGVSGNPSDPNYNPYYDPNSPQYVNAGVSGTSTAGGASGTPPPGFNGTTWTGGAINAQNIGAMLQYASSVRGGGNFNADPNYWLNVVNTNPGRDPNTIFQQMLGYGAGGSDVAQSGPYAGQNWGRARAR